MMKISNLISKSLKYGIISKELAHNKNRSRLITFLRMILCKIVSGHNALNYAIYCFDEKSMSRWSEYITKKELSLLQEKINPSRFTSLVKNKLAFYERCTAENIPTPNILAIIANSNLQVPQNIPIIQSKESLSDLFAQHDNKTLFLKITDGSYGEGALSIKLKRGNIYDPFDKKLSIDTILSHCLMHKQKSFLVQEHLSSHKDVHDLMPGPALGTFRLVTLLQKYNNDVNIPYAFAKIPVRGNIVDNFQHGESGNLVCGIDVSNGRLMHGRGTGKGGRSVLRKEKHPDTQLVFTDFTVPFWGEIVRLTTRAAKAFAEFGTLGWDIAITNKGLYILEANCRWDPDLPQITLNNGIKSNIRHMLSSVTK